MYIVTLAEAKKHLNIESYFTEDDAYITSLIDVAFYSIRNKCNNWWWEDSSGVTVGTTDFADLTIKENIIPLPIKHAILLMVGNLYTNREPVSFGSPSSIPYTLTWLIEPYINYEGPTTTTTTIP